MNDARHKYKRERERVNGSNANTEIYFEVRAPSSTSPPSHRRISNPLTYPPRTPTQGTSTEDLGQIQPGVHNSSLNRIQPHTEAPQTPPHTRGVGPQPIQINHLTLEGFNHKLHLSLERAKHQSPPLTRGSQPPLHNQPLPKRDTNNKEGYNLVVYLNHKQLFPQIKDPNRQDRMIQLKCGKRRVWKSKTQRKPLGKQLG